MVGNNLGCSPGSDRYELAWAISWWLIVRLKPCWVNLHGFLPCTQCIRWKSPQVADKWMCHRLWLAVCVLLHTLQPASASCHVGLSSWGPAAPPAPCMLLLHWLIASTNLLLLLLLCIVAV